MIDQNNLCFGQRFDHSNGLIEPWLTNPAMDVIKKWDLSDKVVLEYGGGASTIWWANKAKFVYTIETNTKWMQSISYYFLGMYGINVQLYHRPINEGDQSRVDEYTAIPEGCKPDIVVVDGILRYECIQKALTLPRPLTLIVDNWQQDYVFMCPAAEELLKPFEGSFYIQPDHIDHEGHPWQTAIFNIK